LRAEPWISAGRVCDVIGLDKAAVSRSVALVHDMLRLTFAQLASAIDRLAYRLIDLGFRSLDRVVFQLPNSIEFVINLLRTAARRRDPGLALPAHRREEISHIFAHTKAVGYVVPNG
jgi:2,3-dihydroxybenzoate-AMP ligase